MTVDIRQHIKENFKETGIDEIKNSIVSGIESKEEIALPGLGVFFELLWNNGDENSRQYILDTIKKGIQIHI